MKIKTRLATPYKFRQDIEKKGSLNAVQGFWFGFIYEKYANGKMNYEAALKMMQDMRAYTGV